MINTYNRNTKLDFGMYEGYDLGIVYVFDPFYIDWCINNISWFHITDINELKYFGVISLDFSLLEVARRLQDPSVIEGIDKYESFQELIKNIDLGNLKYPISNETIELNFAKKNAEFSNKSNPIELDYEKQSYTEYGGYNDWSDQTIDDAFEGDPENTWNVD